MIRRDLTAIWLLALVWVAASGWAQSEVSAGQLLVISKPAAPVVPSDPPLGHIFYTPTALSAAATIFDTSGGPVSLEYIRIENGKAFITFDDGPSEAAPGGVLIIDDFLARSGGTFDAARDLLISGDATGLMQPKDLVVTHEGMIIVADFAAKAVSVFRADAQGDAAPEFVTSELGGERAPWGLDYDAENDRLFVGATDGTILVYDAFLSRQGAAGPKRVISPSLNGQKVAANTHDVIYLPETDRLIAADVGGATTADQPGFDSDGKLFIIDGASTADGPTEVTLELSGPASMLGNPITLAFDGQNLYVAEKTKNLVLRFDDILTHQGALELAPDAAVSVVKPESILMIEATAD